jgi:hypothetical protein
LSSIILVRHGPVALKAPGLLSFEGFCDYADAYEFSGIEAGAMPPGQVARLVGGARTIFASDAPRVSETLTLFGVEAAITDPAIREAPPQAPSLPLRLPAIVWLALARARGTFDPALEEARSDLRRRALQCADRLIEASATGDVALVGHGWFNRFVARAISERGRRKTAGPGFGRPWGHIVFHGP